MLNPLVSIHEFKVFTPEMLWSPVNFTSFEFVNPLSSPEKIAEPVTVIFELALIPLFATIVQLNIVNKPSKVFTQLCFLCIYIVAPLSNCV